MRFRDPDMEALARELEAEGIGRVIDPPSLQQLAHDLNWHNGYYGPPVMAARDAGMSVRKIAAAAQMKVSDINGIIKREMRRRHHRRLAGLPID